MNTRRNPLPAQSNGIPSPYGDRVGGRLRAGADTGAAGHGLTRRTAVLAVGTALTAALGGCGLRLGKGSPASLPSASAAETTRDGLARQAALISSTAGVVAQAGGGDATTAALAEGVKQTADAQLETLGGVWQPWPSQVPSSYPTVAPVPSASAGASAQDLATALADGSTLARRAAIAAASEQDARLFTSLTVAWSLQHDLFKPPSSADTPRAEVAQGSKISSGLLTSYDAARYAMEELAARSDDPQRTRAIADAKAATSVVNAAVAAGTEDKRLSAYAAPSESTDPNVSTQVLWARQVWSNIVSSEVQEAGSAKASSPAREAAVTGAVDAARRATAWGADFSSLPGYAA
ncbi:Tat pathway signal protein [Actinomyces stomatis]|uniref:Tat pathway signal protein n=1 Tax=Actinomyces stomatis TaxID=3050227 RepID=UPI002852BF16|nr:Tat pathway signal protein [Actinomyces sp. PK606]